MTIFDITIFGLHITPTYYGLMYAIAFLAGYYIIKSRNIINGSKLDDLFFYIFLGVVLGGRFGYVFFYDFSNYLTSPLNILKVWEGGMSFHGGVIGVVISMILFARKYKISFYRVADEVTAILPIGLGLGRIGNYLNKELLGFSPYNGFLSVQKEGIGYFPSPLLESFLEGLILYFILRYFYNRKNSPYSTIVSSPPQVRGIKGEFKDGQIASLFLIFYGIFRIFVEAFFRTPDLNIGYILGFLTMGEILSIPMILAGIYFYKKVGQKT